MSGSAERIQVRARDIREGDLYVTGPKGRELRRRVASFALNQRPDRVHACLTCEDGSTPVLGSEQLVTVERIGGES